MLRFCSRLALLSLVVCTARPASAQLGPMIRLSAEITPIVAIPWGDFGADDGGIGASTSVGYAAGIVVDTRSIVDLYGQYQAVRFGCGECEAAGLDSRVGDKGWGAGVQLEPELPLLRFQPWLRAGLIGHQLELSGEEGTVFSKPRLGFGLGAGIDVPVSYVFDLLPSVAFRRYAASYDFESFPGRETNVTYLTVGLGLAYRF